MQKSKTAASAQVALFATVFARAVACFAVGGPKASHYRVHRAEGRLPKRGYTRLKMHLWQGPNSA